MIKQAFLEWLAQHISHDHNLSFSSYKELSKTRDVYRCPIYILHRFGMSMGMNSDLLSSLSILSLSKILEKNKYMYLLTPSRSCYLALQWYKSICAATLFVKREPVFAASDNESTASWSKSAPFVYGHHRPHLGYRWGHDHNFPHLCCRRGAQRRGLQNTWHEDSPPFLG